ncbi:MAG: hypothetical protein JW830_05200 [Bacteroidales bacterium]|nr:hypothetical protein [Bacteroidales bacterium]
MLAFPEMLKNLTPVRRLFSKGSSFRKHFLEKMADLLAIVVSIYLALSIEGWAEKRIEHKKLKQYYHNLISEIEKDTIALTDVIADAERHVTIERKHFKMISTYQPGLEDSVTSLFQGMVSSQLFGSSSMVSYQSMTLSGDIRLIENLEVRDKLIEQEEVYKGLKIWEDLYLDYFRNEVINRFFGSFNWLDNTLLDKQLYTSPEYAIMLVKSISFNENRAVEYKNALQKARTTHAILKKELGIKR